MLPLLLRSLLAASTVAVVLAGCSAPSGQRAAEPTSPPASSTAAGPRAVPSTAGPSPPAPSALTPSVPEPLTGLGTARVDLDGRVLVVAVADDPPTRARGLMGVTDLGELDGMLFVWEEDSTSAFWMKDTPIPLDIAWFDAAGRLVGRATMVPCEADPCPLYPAGGPYRFALEVPAGELDLLTADSMLAVTG